MWVRQALRRAARPPRHAPRRGAAGATSSAAAGDGGGVPGAVAALGAGGLIPFLWYGVQVEADDDAGGSGAGTGRRARAQAALSHVTAGLAPAAAAAADAVFGAASQADVRAAFSAYSVAILSFLGGVHWGVAASGGGGRVPAAALYAWGVTPSLVGWAGARAAAPVARGTPAANDARAGRAYVGLAASYAAVWAVDTAVVSRGALPAWYPRVRTPLTAAVAATHAAAGAALWAAAGKE
jgi:hypothetical protein